MRKRRKSKRPDRRDAEIREAELRRSAVLPASVTVAERKGGGEEAEPPLDVMRLAICRRIYTALEYPRRCRAPVCRRVKRCAGPTLRCERDIPAPPDMAAQWEKAKPEILRLLKARVAEFGG